VWKLSCALVAAAFLWSSVSRVILGFSGRFHGLGEPYHSTDLYLHSLTEVPECSARFSELVSRVPEDKPILIILRQGSPRGSLMGMVLAYLAWPHRARIMTIAGTDPSAELAQVRPDSIGAVAFCEMRPPAWLQKGVAVGTAINFVPLPTRVAVK